MSNKVITVINLGYIGDVLNISPITRALSQQYPDKKIVVITSPGSVEVAKYLPGVSDVVGFSRYNEHKGIKILNFALDFRKKYKTDTAIILTENFRAAMLAFLIGARKRIGKSFDGRDFLLTNSIPFTDEEKKLEVHVTEQFASTLKPLEFELSDYSLGFQYNPEVVKKFADLISAQNLDNKQLLGFCPAAGTKDGIFKVKTWDVDEACKFLQQINQEGKYKVVLVGQHACEEFANQMKAKGQSDFIDLTHKTNISELGAVVSLFDKFISVDSAPMHMGFAVNTPTICLFFQDNHKKWGPRDKKNNSLLFSTHITATEVMSSLEQLESIR